MTTPIAICLMQVHRATCAPGLETLILGFHRPSSTAEIASALRTSTVSAEQLSMDNDEDLPCLVPRTEQ